MLEAPKNPRVRAAAKLADRGARQESGWYLLEGPQALRELLDFRPELLIEAFATERAIERHPELIAAAKQHAEVVLASERVVAAIADTVAPQGIVAVAKQHPLALDQLLASSPRHLVILHEIRDPGNLGTILRVADAAGADGIVVTASSVDVFNPKVVRATTGSLFHVPFSVGVATADVLEAVRSRGLRVLAADVTGEDLRGIASELAEPTAWLFGNEARGLDASTLGLADRTVRVPVFGSAESLNLATAASVCIYQTAFAQHER